MGLPEFDSAPATMFGVEIDGKQINQITEISGIDIKQDVVEYKGNAGTTGKYLHQNLPGRTKAPDITITRALTNDSLFDKWKADAIDKKMDKARKGGSIIVFDYSGKPAAKFTFRNAWPKSLEIGALKAGDTSILTEKIVLVCEEGFYDPI